ncbi:putative conserved secreted protein [Cyanobium sp. NS01]|nr:putative conserved secreted protein [Cyanobium sp. NS01]
MVGSREISRSMAVSNLNQSFSLTRQPWYRRAAPAVALLLAALALVPPLLSQPARSQSQLLESVKRNPAKAKKLCAQLRQMNADGVSYTSRKATRVIATQENLSPGDAEVLTTYVVGLHCPDVR